MQAIVSQTSTIRHACLSFTAWAPGNQHLKLLSAEIMTETRGNGVSPNFLVFVLGFDLRLV